MRNLCCCALPGVFHVQPVAGLVVSYPYLPKLQHVQRYRKDYSPVADREIRAAVPHSCACPNVHSVYHTSLACTPHVLPGRLLLSRLFSPPCPCNPRPCSMLLLLSLYVALVARVWAGWGPANHLPPHTPSSAPYPSSSSSASASASPLSPTSLMALALDLAPSLVATAPVAILAVAWPLSSRPTWRRLVRHSMGWRLAAHLAAGAMVGWGGWAPSPGVNGYHLGPGVVVGDGVIYLGTATVRDERLQAGDLCGIGHV